MLGGVPGRMENLDPDLTHLDPLAVFDRLVVVAEHGGGRAEQRDPLAGRELRQTGEIVIVAVAVDAVTDPQALRSGHVEVAVDLALRVEDERLPGLFGADQVGGVPEILEEELLEEHVRAFR